MIGSTVRLNGSVTNVGNALESSMDIGFELSTSPPTNGVIGFLTAGVGGPTSEPGEVLTLPMSAGSSKLILWTSLSAKMFLLTHELWLQFSSREYEYRRGIGTDRASESHNG